MLRLKPDPLSVAAADHLKKKQGEIAGYMAFGDQVLQAKNAWAGKSASATGRDTFIEIQDKLLKAHPAEGLCHYCEQSEAGDIEHILPKSIFPDQAFVWENYLYACKQCNTRYKRDQMYAFDPAGSVSSVKLTPPPATHDYTFIHSRYVDPMDWMQLNLDDFFFYARLPHTPGTRGYEQVERTLEILALNNRSVLVKYRKRALEFYKNKLNEYVNAKKATTYAQLDTATLGIPAIDRSLGFSAEQNRILSIIRANILTSEHPTVWREMVRQHGSLPHPVQDLFRSAPEALTW